MYNTVQLIFFSSTGWQSWDVRSRPVIPDGMPLLVDDGMVFENASGPRPVVLNGWLRQLPSSGRPALASWASYARVRRVWLDFLIERGVGLFDERPPRPTELPIPFPVPAGVTKGGKYRTTWISYPALAEVHRYLELARPLAVDARPGSRRPSPVGRWW
jgi:hypothetical protein